MNESIIELLQNEKDFLESVKKRVTVNAKLVECMSVDDVKSNDCFKEGHYLLVNDKQLS